MKVCNLLINVVVLVISIAILVIAVHAILIMDTPLTGKQRVQLKVIETTKSLLSSPSEKALLPIEMLFREFEMKLNNNSK